MSWVRVTGVTLQMSTVMHKFKISALSNDSDDEFGESRGQFTQSSVSMKYFFGDSPNSPK